MLVRVLGVQLQINPLLLPVPDDAPNDRPYLKWNMLFPSSNCQRSTDPPHLSWAGGRRDPATFPRVTSVRVVCETLPWVLTIAAVNTEIGLTCGDVIDQLSASLNTLSSETDFRGQTPARQTLISDVYQHNRSRAHGVPGGSLLVGMKRLDFLGRDTVFGGLVTDERAAERLAGVRLPCTLVLKCLRQFALTAQEISDQRARERAAAAEDARRAAAAADADAPPTTDSDADDGT